jgi:pyruvate formate lyase activating enzyme
MKKAGVWLEVTTLLIPGLNDDTAELRQLATFIRRLGPETPWHVSRFHPTYRMLDRPSTPISTLHQARQIGLEAGLHYVYTGNIPGDDAENTYCHQCGNLLIKRRGYSISRQGIHGSLCNGCNSQLAGIGIQ